MGSFMYFFYKKTVFFSSRDPAKPEPVVAVSISGKAAQPGRNRILDGYSAFATEAGLPAVSGLLCAWVSVREVPGFSFFLQKG